MYNVQTSEEIFISCYIVLSGIQS